MMKKFGNFILVLIFIIILVSCTWSDNLSWNPFGSLIQSTATSETVVSGSVASPLYLPSPTNAYLQAPT